ncbi:MAG: AAA family ATPase [Gammaproteobacteria bacterium]|nr:AAA family ATPase [Gammaproteobacteria bacterium]
MSNSEKQQVSVVPPDSQEAFELQCEPFADAIDNSFFYSEQARIQRLRLLQHLASYSELLMVVGADGIGKTTLLEQFIFRAKESAHICSIQATQMMDAERFTEQLLDGFQLSPDEGGDKASALSLDALFNLLCSVQQEGRHTVIIIDDAHLLSLSALKLVLQLVEAAPSNDHSPHIILFCAPSIDKALSTPAVKPLLQRINHTFEMAPLSETECAGYIRHRLGVAGLDGEGPFDDAVVHKIYKASQGIPAQVNALAREVLQGRPVASVTEESATEAGAGNKLKWIVGGLVAVILAAVLLMQDTINSMVSSDTEKPQVAMQQRSTPIALPPQSSAKVVVPAAQPPVQKAPPAQPAVTKPEPTAPKPPALAQAKPETAQQAKPAEPVKQAVAAPQTPAPAAPAPAPAPVVAKAAEPAPVKAEPVKPAVAEKQPVPTVSPALSAVEGAVWLLDQNPKYYTIQLIATSRESSAVAFIKSKGLEDKSAIFRVDRNGKTVYPVVYGVYPDRRQAQQAAGKLPDIEGWVRTVAGIQKTLR